MTQPLPDGRLDEIREMKFTTGVNAACGIFDTPVERELYDLAAKNYNARLELVREVDRLRAELHAAADSVEALHPAVYADAGQRTAEGILRAAAHLRSRAAQEG